MNVNSLFLLIYCSGQWWMGKFGRLTQSDIIYYFQDSSVVTRRILVISTISNVFRDLLLILCITKRSVEKILQEYNKESILT